MDKFTYVEYIVKYLKNKNIEIYLGDTYEVLKNFDTDKYLYTMICGKVLDGSGDCLVVECLNADKTTNGNIAYINGYSIKAITELCNGTISDMFLTPGFSKRVSK